MEGTVWPAWTLHWDLPENVTPLEVLARHSVPRLLERLEENLALQVIEHRGMFNLGKRIQECTASSLLTALCKGGRNLSELDVCLTLDNVPIVSHDLNTWRVSENLGDKLFNKIHSSAIKDVPVIIREVSNGVIQDQYLETVDHIPFLDELLRKVFSANPDATIFLDGRNYEAHVIVAWLSHRPEYHQRVVVLFYTFEYLNGAAFVDAILKAQPASDWRKSIALMPAVFPEELCRLACLRQVTEPTVDDLYLAGKAWIDSILMQDMRIVAIHVVFSRVTRNLLGQVIDKDVLLAFDSDEAAVRLAYYVKEDAMIRAKRPHLKFAAVNRCYDFAASLECGERGEFSIDIKTGRARRHETDERKHLRWRKGTPGNSATIADWVISDRSEDEMAVWEWRNQGIDREVSHLSPHLDVNVDTSK
ncbi:agrocinopine synthase (plasmid) [Agrobacterium tumefaciens]|uniref:Agrocinopine synthase n=2 Tax=Agrobacterium tumefaciens complex TaxID=1183400 RepID=A0AAE6EIG5_AGRTU|nr:agrocinopine synthase [Agrobacterium genomosp. 6]ASK41365.1 agrocinopine synthase [Agrobacterium genomosp. 6]QCL77583.1 agrocinopine synthase [Agrobacterium tumefaciens]QCL83073.1 agrocinopine synthase [Agrobacterium tumefaciens]